MRVIDSFQVGKNTLASNHPARDHSPCGSLTIALGKQADERLLRYQVRGPRGPSQRERSSVNKQYRPPRKQYSQVLKFGKILEGEVRQVSNEIISEISANKDERNK